MSEALPILEQYRRIKHEQQGNVLLFRLGDFYEMFCEDALEVSALLNLTLTSRNGVPMCGIPYHAARSYIARLLKAGKKIAVCEQMSEQGKWKGLIERKVVEIITPGTTVDEDYLDAERSNYLCALAQVRGALSFASIDISTGDFYAAQWPIEEGTERLKLELERLAPKELIVQEGLLQEDSPLNEVLTKRPGLLLDKWANWLFDENKAAARLARQFNSVNLKGFGIASDSPCILAAGIILEYLDQTSRSLLPHVRTLKINREEDFVGLDETTQRNLELTASLHEEAAQFTLFGVLDTTRSGMGKRLLRRRLLFPLRDLDLLEKRLSMVETFYQNSRLLDALREILRKSPDLARFCSRLAMEKTQGKDLLAIRKSLEAFQALRSLTSGFYFESSEAANLDANALTQLDELQQLLQVSLADDPSILSREGNLIKAGYNAELDRFKALACDGRKVLEAYLEEERLKTGITNLKMNYNRLIGYYFEVNKANLAKVPVHFSRRQGTAAGERFTTDRLIHLESDINSASDRAIELEKELFLDLCASARALLVQLAAASVCIAEIDVAQSLALTAALRGWTRPSLNDGHSLRIIDGRHPVVEANLPHGEFIPNDTILDEAGIAFALITGPNMAGKSTYLRQTALITLMAQMGSFVPAKEAVIGLVDRIYCRVGASDSLARGESTFLVEMNETANILNTATDRSLVIMDEVGRGTGAKDGLSIAQAVCEELLDHIKCRTLFATHYHELSFITHPRLANRSMEVIERGGELVFLRKLKEGASGESYGLHVARMAGICERVVSRAQHIMDTLSNAALNHGLSAQASPAPSPTQTASLVEALTALDLFALTPQQALAFIADWKERLESEPSKIASQRTAKRQGKHEPELPGLFDFF
ncbi:DNA mismatch repair protein MutS [Spirochaetia bacterium]|nr:DNA mismatch repair protein MutS [Spirochaetia bacterium]